MPLPAYLPGTNSRRVTDALLASPDLTSSTAELLKATGLMNSSLAPTLRDMVHRRHLRKLSRGTWRLTDAHPMLPNARTPDAAGSAQYTSDTPTVGTVAPRPQDISCLHPVGWKNELVAAAAAGDIRRVDAVIDRMAALGLCAPRAPDGVVGA